MDCWKLVSLLLFIWVYFLSSLSVSGRSIHEIQNLQPETRNLTTIRVFPTANCSGHSKVLHWDTFNKQCTTTPDNVISIPPTSNSSHCVDVTGQCKNVGSFLDERLLDVRYVSLSDPTNQTSLEDKENFPVPDDQTDESDIDSELLVKGLGSALIKKKLTAAQKQNVVRKVEGILKGHNVRPTPQKIESMLGRYGKEDSAAQGVSKKLLSQSGNKNPILNPLNPQLRNQPRLKAEFISQPDIRKGEYTKTPKGPLSENSVLQMKYDKNGNILSIETDFRAGHVRETAIDGERATADISKNVRDQLEGIKSELQNKLKGSGVDHLVEIKTTQAGHRVGHSAGGTGADIENFFVQDASHNARQGAWEKKIKNYRALHPNKEIRVVHNYDYHHYSRDGKFPKSVQADVFERDVSTGQFVKSQSLSMPKSEHNLLKLTSDAVKNMANPFQSFVDVKKAMDAYKAAKAAHTAAQAAQAVATGVQSAQAAAAVQAAEAAVAAAESGFIEVLIGLALG